MLKRAGGIRGKIPERMVSAVLAGVIASLIVFILLVVLVKKDQTRKAPVAAGLKVLVLKKEVPAGAEIRQTDINMVPVSPQMIPYGALVNYSQVRGKRTARAIRTGETLTAFSFAGEKKDSIPQGFVAVSLRVNSVSGVSGMIKTGDRVDVIGTYSMPSGKVSKTVLQAVNVYNLNYKESNREKIVTLLVRLADAQKLLLLYTSGDYTLALRGTGDKTVYPVVAVDSSDVYGKGRKRQVPSSRFGTAARSGSRHDGKKFGITIVEVK